MKCLGLIGGIGWESTVLYYRLINEEVRNRYGSLHSARLVVNSLEFQAIDSLVQANRWNDAGAALAEAARMLERAGAEAVVLCSNLMHYVVEAVAAAVDIPVLHIGDAVLAEARAARVNRLGLVGTRFTLEHDFLLERPAATGGSRRLPVQILTPDPAEFDGLDRIIYGELCRGVVREESRATLLRLARNLRARGAQGIVLASSELALLLRPDDFSLPLFDSTEIHALAVVRWALGEEGGRRQVFQTTGTSGARGADSRKRRKTRG
ncbi:MAG: amino acid racemase [Verrucomicrobia bacterium]|jgi:aspartate racemase|nr:amino acid racemase [Verrucomicrobiota bacterium]